MSDKMREEFEAWALESHGYNSGLTAGGFYYISKMDDLWESWKASRAALCVELPRKGVLHHTTTYNAPDVRSALDAAGVCYK